MQTEVIDNTNLRSDTWFFKRFVGLVVFSLSLWVISIVNMTSASGDRSLWMVTFFFATLFFHCILVGGNLVFGAYSMSKRSLFSSAWFAFILFCLLIMALAESNFDSGIFLAFLTTASGALGLSCLVCFIGRFLFGLYLSNGKILKRRSSDNFQIRHVLGVMTVLAIFLATGRGLVLASNASTDLGGSLWIFISLIVASVTITVGLLASILIVRWSLAAVIVSLIAMILLSVFEALVLERHEPNQQNFQAILWVNGWVAINCLPFGYLVRFAGYRLRLSRPVPQYTNQNNK